MNQESSVIIVTKAQNGQLSNLFSIPDRRKKFFSPSKHPDWLWGWPLFDGYWGLIFG
jgi:hypothetical protein